MEKGTYIAIDEARFVELMEASVKSMISSARSINDEINHWIVDRRFLERNFNWRRRKIEAFEASGKLEPILTNDGKTKYYELSRCKALYDIEKANLNP